MSITLFLEPLDPLFFRDNRPFSAGEDVFGETTLPSPLTVFGAIGSHLLKRNSTDLRGFFSGKVEDPLLGRYDGDLKNTRLKIKGPFLMRRDKIYFSPPANLYYINDLLQTLRPETNASPMWDIKDNSLKPVSIPEGDFKPVKEFIQIEDIKRWLAGERLKALKGCKEEELYLREKRFGHKLSRDTLTVEEGFLYITEHLRFIDELEVDKYFKSGIVLSVEGVDDNILEDTGVFLGGEKRRAYLKRIDISFSFNSDGIIEKAIKNKRFFLYFVTSSIFSNGFDKGKWPDEFQNSGATLIGAAVNKPLYLSGWKRQDIARGHPRRLKRAVPAGSVYFFECSGNMDGNKFNELYNKYNFNESLSDEYHSAGFGITLIGVW